MTAASRLDSGPSSSYFGVPDPGQNADRNQFGTFTGVFTPTILTILGVIMFMLSGFVIGQGGIWQAFIILIIAKTITLATSLSIAAISTNTQVSGGGAYFLISRSLGPEFGGAIGLALYLAQALSVPFYIIGFTQALVLTFPSLATHFLEIGIVVAALLFVLAYVGANWAIKVQFFVLLVLVASIIIFMGGAIADFDMALFTANQGPAPARFEPLPFWALFALYFPAVTGIMAGVNMSGDLKDPAKSLPRGTLAAVAVGFLVYGAQCLLLGGAVPREALIAKPYQSLVEISLFGLGFMVTAGVFAATVSSAIGSFIGAPRVLQALARDNLLSPLKAFGQGTRRGDEPRRALILTMAITLAVLWWAGSSGGEDSLKSVAAVVAMFFLATYGVTNLAAFVEAIGANPSFRPRFRFFHWSASLVGAVGCIGAALLIDPLAAVTAGGVVWALWYYVRRKDLTTSFGDARRGYTYTRVRNNLLRLDEMPTDAKNWRPTVLVLSGNPHTRLTLITYALWLEAGRGVVTMAQVMVGEFHELAQERRDALVNLRQFARANKVPAFAEVAVVADFDQGLRVLLQTHSLGPLKPNIVLFGWSTKGDRAREFHEHLRVAREIGMSLLLLADRGLPTVPGPYRRIDIWWRGRRNGSLMLILAHLLSSNPDWGNSRIRVLRMTSRTEQRAEAEREMRSLADAARIDVDIAVLQSDRPFPEVLHEQSSDATVVFLGFRIPPPDQDEAFHDTFMNLLDGLPTTILVSSTGDADLLA